MFKVGDTVWSGNVPADNVEGLTPYFYYEVIGATNIGGDLLYSLDDCVGGKIVFAMGHLLTLVDEYGTPILSEEEEERVESVEQEEVADEEYAEYLRFKRMQEKPQDYVGTVTLDKPFRLADIFGEPEPDMVNHPPHYNHGGIESLDVIRMCLTKKEFKGYLKGQVLKYRERAPYKGKTDEDYAKAKFYYDVLMEMKSKKVKK